MTDSSEKPSISYTPADVERVKEQIRNNEAVIEADGGGAKRAAELEKENEALRKEFEIKK